MNGGVSGLIPVDFGDPESVRDTLLELRDDHRKMSELNEASRSFAEVIILGNRNPVATPDATETGQSETGVEK